MMHLPGRIYLLLLLLVSCSQVPEPATTPARETARETSRDGMAGKPSSRREGDESFRWETERFADLRILRYRVPGFEELSLNRKKLVYCLYEAALCGREIIYDQKYRYNLPIKRLLEQIVRAWPGNRDSEAFGKLLVYLKRIWFSNGIHHHYSGDKFDPGFSPEDLEAFVKATPGPWPTRPGQTIDDLLEELKPVIFDPKVDAKLVNKARGADLVRDSAVNFYSPDLTQREVERFYAKRIDPRDPHPVSHGLNSKLVRGGNGELEERVWKVGGLYTQALEKVVAWLEKALPLAENDAQRESLRRLITYYRTGDLRDWDAYNIAWVADTASDIDTINGFIEVYNDPMGYHGSWESVVQVRDPIATRRIETIASAAQWFEDHSPLLPAHKKPHVKGISARVINVVVEGGDASPATPIGINLPNANWIRAEHGSKSVNLANIVAAYNHVAGASLHEFAWSQEEIAREKKYGELADALHTDMHEVIGHASGRLNPGVGTPKETLKNYASTLEEARADLVALYYLMDEKLIDLGLMPSLEVGKAAYDGYIKNGLMLQLRRIKPGRDIEEDHMRNRQLVARWVMERGAPKKVIERKQRDGKTYFVINDYEGLRALFGDLLREIQRIKSEGDFAAGQHLVETYGVKVDPELHREVLARYAKLDVPSYSGFINPRLTPVIENGRIIDVRITYPEDFKEQMLRYAREYAFLPDWN